MASSNQTGRQMAIDYSSDSNNSIMTTVITSAQSNDRASSTLKLSDLLSDDGSLSLPTSSSSYDGPSRSAAGDPGDPIKILILGDSYTTKSSALFAALDRELDFSGYDVQLVTKAKNGAFMADGMGQLNAGLKSFKGVDAVMVMLGSNDGIFSRSIGNVEQSLDRLLSKLDAKGLPTLVAGTYGDWPLQGAGYATSAQVNQFEALFGRQANKHGDVFYEHILDGAYGVNGRTSDGEHPNSAGARVIASNMSDSLNQLLSEVAG